MKRPVTMVAWLYAPGRLSLSEAAALLGPDPALLEFPIYDAGLDAREVDGQSLISKESLRDYLETALEVAQGLWD